MTEVTKFITAEQAAFRVERATRLEALDAILADNPGPWGYKDLVGALIAKAGAPTVGYPAHSVDVLIKDQALVRQSDGKLMHRPNTV